MARIRTFIGVEVGNEIRSSATAIQQTLARSGAEVNWVPADNFHITMLFLGEVDDRDLHAVCQVISRSTASEPPFTLRVSGIGAFPNLRRPKIIWAGITEGSTQLVGIHGMLEEPLMDLGAYRREDRPYSPHLTLGRVKSEADGQTLAPSLTKHTNWEAGRATVSEVILYASDLRREGPVYTVLARAKLEG